MDLSCGKGCEVIVLSKGKRFEIRGTTNGSVPCLERRAAEHVSWIRKRVINPKAFVRGANRDVSCDIAIVIEDERRQDSFFGSSPSVVDWNFALVRLPRDEVAFFLRSECFRLDRSTCLNDFRW